MIYVFNHITGNIVWFDNLSAARAMLGLSKKIIGSIVKDRENDLENRKDSEAIAYEENESDADKDGKEENCINIKDIKYPLPPGIWRKGVECPKSKEIFLRFATRMDKKPANAEKKSEYYKKYGNPNFGGKFCLQFCDCKKNQIDNSKNDIIFFLHGYFFRY